MVGIDAKGQKLVARVNITCSGIPLAGPGGQCVHKPGWRVAVAQWYEPADWNGFRAIGAWKLSGKNVQGGNLLNFRSAVQPPGWKPTDPAVFQRASRPVWGHTRYALACPRCAAQGSAEKVVVDPFKAPDFAAWTALDLVAWTAWWNRTQTLELRQLQRAISGLTKRQERREADLHMTLDEARRIYVEKGAIMS